MFRHLFLIAVVMLTGLTPVIGSAVELGPTLKVGDQTLVLNGSGTREKYFLDLYVAGLYLTQPNNQSATIINADAPMAIRIVITSKLVSQEKFLSSLQEGFNSSTQGKVEPLRNEIQKFRECFADEISRNDVYDLIYVPNHGVVVFKGGKPKGTVPGLAFKQALFGIWLCDQPADANLKQAMLSGGNVRR